MDARVRSARKSDFFEVYRLLSGSTLNSRALPLDARRRMFEGVWGGQGSTPGFVLEHDDRIVGFLGTLSTERIVGGEAQKFCELHSWYVEEEFRSESLLLFMPALSRRNVTYLNYTPTLPVYEIGKKFGFSDLESELVLFYPIPRDFRALKITTDKSRIPDYLSDEDARIFYDHRDTRCHHVVVTSAGRSKFPPLYLIVKSMRRRWWEPFGRVLYVSDQSTFNALSGALAWRLCFSNGWQCLVANGVDVDPDRMPRFTRRIKRGVPSQFKSKTLKSSDIKPLYTLPLLIGYELH